MDTVLANVSTTAVWLGLGAWLLLGAWMAVQAIVDAERRARCAAFAAVVFFRAALDFAHGSIPISAYELARLAWAGAFAGSVLFLLGHAPRRILAAAAGILLLGAAVWLLGRNAVATSATFPVAFGLAALAFARTHRDTRGYASAVLCAYTAAMALTCATYYAVMKVGDPRVTTLGYANMAFLNALAVVLGWIHLPRELRGRAPVRVEPAHALAHLAAIVAAETLVVLGLLFWFAWPPVVYLAGMTLLLLGSSMLFFYHRHQLVIYADNVTHLLELRTASLREAQTELSQQNEIQARRLEEQARELNAKAEVIERQRRLELAAQTAGQAAHDIQNLVQPVLEQIAALRRRAGDDAAVREAADRARVRLEQLLDLNGQMLSLARRGRMDFHPVALLELARDTAAMFPAARVAIECAEEPWVQGSWSQLSRALGNLLRNALEAASRPHDRVVLRLGVQQVGETRRCHLGFLHPDRYAVVEIEDTGPGIPASMLEHIFEPFFSSKSGPHRSGSGLGLAIVTAVAEDHAAVLDLRTGPAGTCFTLYLPAADPPPQAVDFSALRGTELVLLADDDPAILRHYGDLLRAAGYQVIAVENGQLALHALENDPVDLVVLDLDMPRATGLEVFLGAVHRHGHVRAMVHSGFVTGDDADRLRALGVAALLSKPAGRAEFLRTVRSVLDARAGARPLRVVSS